MVNHTARELQDDLSVLHDIKTDLLLRHLRTPSGSSDERDIAERIADCEVEILRREEMLVAATGHLRIVPSPINVVLCDEDEISRMMDEGCPWD